MILRIPYLSIVVNSYRHVQFNDNRYVRFDISYSLCANDSRNPFSKREWELVRRFSLGIRQIARLYHEDYVIDAAVMCTLTCRDAFSIGNIQSNRRLEEINRFELKQGTSREVCAQCRFHFMVTISHAPHFYYACSN